MFWRLVKTALLLTIGFLLGFAVGVYENEDPNRPWRVWP